MRCTIIVLLALALVGCTSAVKMQKASTGETAQCGPYGFGLAFGGAQLAARESQCISDYQRQGYERMP